MNKEEYRYRFDDTHNMVRQLHRILYARVNAYDNIETDNAVTAANYIHEKAVLDIVNCLLDNIDSLNGHIEFISDPWEEE